MGKTMQDREHDVNSPSSEQPADDEQSHSQPVALEHAEGRAQDSDSVPPEAAFDSHVRESDHPQPPQTQAGRDQHEQQPQNQSSLETIEPIDSRPHVFTERISLQQISFKASEAEAVELRGARTLMTSANILGPLSLFFGGVLASSVGLGAAIAAYFKLDKVGKNHPDDPRIWQILTRQALVSIMVTGSALVLNIIAAILFYPIILEAVQTGDFSTLFNGFGTTPSVQEAAPAGGNSTWG